MSAPQTTAPPRPPATPWVDLLVLADGSLLVSDDHAGAIHRIVYEHGA